MAAVAALLHANKPARFGRFRSESKATRWQSNRLTKRRKTKQAKTAQTAGSGRCAGETEEGQGGQGRRRGRLEREGPAPEKPKPAPRPPADPRLKVLKKFYGKFLPRGPLRDRHKALMARWNSGEDHGGVTVEELKSLHEDWKNAREKPACRPRRDAS